jgi:hypothetical protein
VLGQLKTALWAGSFSLVVVVALSRECSSPPPEYVELVSGLLDISGPDRIVVFGLQFQRFAVLVTSNLAFWILNILT